MRKTVIVFLLSSAFLAAACSRSDKLSRDQKNYEVVQEGSAGAVTSTITAPGETAPPLMPGMTGTNADTTTAFNLPGVTPAPTSSAPPGTIAGTLPTDTGYRDPRISRTPSRPQPAQPRQPETRPEPAPQPPSTSTMLEPAPQTPPPSSTDTTAAERTREEKKEEPAPPTPPPTNTSTNPS